MEDTSNSTTRNPVTAEELSKLQLKTLFSAEEAARYLGLCSKTVRTQTKRGLIPHLRIGRFIRYRRIALDGLLAKLEKGGLK
jgi:excisionase family DNA binding protein